MSVNKNVPVSVAFFLPWGTGVPSCAYAEFWLPWVSTSITRCLGEELGRKDTCCQYLDYIVLMLLVWVDGLVDPHLWCLNWSTWQKLVAVKCVKFLKFFLILLLSNWRFQGGKNKHLIIWLNSFLFAHESNMTSEQKCFIVGIKASH